MDPELKAYLDAISHNIRASMDALNRSMLPTIDCVTAPVTASTDATELAIAGCVIEPVTPSSGATELATASAREAQLPALVPAIGEALGVAPVAPIDTITVVPASCSTECVAQAVTASTTTTLLPWVSGSSSSPDTSVTNDVVSTEVVHDNEAGEHGICEESSIADTNEHLALVVSSSSSSWQSIQAPVTTVALIQEGVPELSVEPMAVMSLDVSSPSTRNDYNLSTNGVPMEVVSLTIAGALPPVSAPVISAPIIQLQQLHNGSELFQPSSSQHVISIVPVHRPSPWPSFMCVHADANEAQPLPWPAFTGINDCESPSEAIMKQSWRCTSVAVNLLGNNNYSGNICISISCITIHDMFSARELRCWNDVLLLLEYGWFGSACVPSAHPVVVVSCEHLVVDSIHFAGSSLSAGCSSVVGCSEFPVQSPIYFFIASESVTWLDTMDVHLLDFPCSALATICSACSQEPGHYLNNYQLKMLVIAAGHWMILVRFQKGQKNSHVLLLPWVWEQEELSLGFQFQQHNILHAWYLCNQSIMASVLPDYSLKYNLLADTWRSRLLCVRSVCAAVHALVFPDSKDSRSWQSAQPAIGCDALLPIIQSVVLICMDYWWLTSAILSETVSIFCARLPVQMEVTYSVQTKWLLAQAYQLNSVGREQVVPLFQNGCVTIPHPTTVYDSMVEWHISMHSPYLFIREMNTGYESILAPIKFCFGGNNLTCFSNSKTPRHDLLVASSEVIWFRVAFACRQRTFQWDPGGFLVASAWGQAAFQGGRDVRSLSYAYSYRAALLGHHMGLGLAASCGLQVTGRRQRSRYPDGSDERRRLPSLPPRL